MNEEDYCQKCQYVNTFIEETGNIFCFPFLRIMVQRIKITREIENLLIADEH